MFSPCTPVSSYDGQAPQTASVKPIYESKLTKCALQFRPYQDYLSSPGKIPAASLKEKDKVLSHSPLAIIAILSSE